MPLFQNFLNISIVVTAVYGSMKATAIHTFRCEMWQTLPPLRSWDVLGSLRQGRVADLQCLCPADVVKVAGGMGVSKGQSQLFLDGTVLWGQAAGGCHCLAAVYFGVYFRNFSDSQKGRLSWDCSSGDLLFVLIPVTMGLSGYWCFCHKKERGLQVTTSPRTDGFMFVGDEHALLEISLRHLLSVCCKV